MRKACTMMYCLLVAASQEVQEVTQQDRQYMQHALTLARKGLGKTFPNPAVGCLIVKQGKVASMSIACSEHDLAESCPFSDHKLVVDSEHCQSLEMNACMHASGHW